MLILIAFSCIVYAGLGRAAFYYWESYFHNIPVCTSRDPYEGYPQGRDCNTDCSFNAFWVALFWPVSPIGWGFVKLFPYIFKCVVILGYIAFFPIIGFFILMKKLGKALAGAGQKSIREGNKI